MKSKVIYGYFHTNGMVAMDIRKLILDSWRKDCANLKTKDSRVYVGIPKETKSLNCANITSKNPIHKGSESLIRSASQKLSQSRDVNSLIAFFKVIPETAALQLDNNFLPVLAGCWQLI